MINQAEIEVILAGVIKRELTPIGRDIEAIRGDFNDLYQEVMTIKVAMTGATDGSREGLNQRVRRIEEWISGRTWFGKEWVKSALAAAMGSGITLLVGILGSLIAKAGT